MLNINSRIGQIIISGYKYFDFYAPEYIRLEILEHQNKIKEIAKLSDNEFLEIYELIVRNIAILNHTIIPLKYYKKAIEICSKIDLDDTVFVAFADYI